MSEIQGHYYDRDGKPCHVQPTKKGAKSPTRPTTVRDAIRLGLLPSVSAVTKMVANEGLTYHKLKQVAEAAYDCPVAAHESKEEYVEHILHASKDGLRKAGDFGSAIHPTLDAYYGQNQPIPDGTLALPRSGAQIAYKTILGPVLDKVKALNLTIQATERVLVNRLGYAGTTDIQALKDGCPVILDWKTKATTPDEPIVAPFTYAMQIAAYWHCISEPQKHEPRGYNVFISSTEPGRVEIKEYGPEELDRAFEAFKHCLELWKIINKHRTEF